MVNQAMAISSGAVRQQLARILTSPKFKKAERLAAMLTFVVEETLAGRASELKEHTLGAEVLRPGGEFSAQADNIVRVQARNLRIRLDEFYNTIGATDELVIRVQKGSYVPQFSRREVRVKSDSATRIAVLPLVNRSSDPELDYFSDGLTEELIGALSRVPGLRVAGRTSSFSFKNAAVDLRKDAAEKLGVEFLVEGSVRHRPDLIRVVANLIEASSGFVRWAETYDVSLSDSVDLQERIAGEIATQLKIVRKSVEPVDHRYGFEVFDLYLKARYEWNLRSKESLAKAMAYYHKACEMDRTFTPAYAGLADCYTLLAIYGYLPAIQMLPKAKEIATQALELDPSSCRALTAMGMIVAAFDWDYDLAEEYFLKAIEIAPSYPDARQWYANFVLSTLGRFDEAADQLAQAWLSDPLSVVLKGDLGNTLGYGGRHLEALEHCEGAVADAPQFFRPHWQIGLTFERMGRFDEAIAAFEKCRALCTGDIFESNAIGALGHALGQAGRTEEAKLCLQDLEMMAGATKITNAISFTLVNLGLGNFEETFKWLNIAADMKMATVIWAINDPRSEPLREDPRFHAFAVRLGLAD